METILKKMSIDTPPTKNGFYLTDYGHATYFPETKNWINNFGPCKPLYWLKEIELPNADIIGNACNEYLKEVGLVENKHLIAHDWESGVSWFQKYITTCE